MTWLHRKMQLIARHGAFFLCGILFFSCQFSSAQYEVRFNIQHLPTNHLIDTIFVAGNFNGWNPCQADYQFTKLADGTFSLVAKLPAGEHSFKFTRGSLQTAEKVNGNDTAIRLFTIAGDTAIQFSITAWKDDSLNKPKLHTASPNVQILDTVFHIAALNSNHKIWLYLPPGYTNSKRRYPVMYLQDGQNLFDEYTANNEEWGIDETVDSMVKKGRPACIIVGIESSPKRINEYSPFNTKLNGIGEGNKYLSFIVKKLKPFIDKQYRTLPNKQNTIIAGGEMGALISYYALLKHPTVFGKAGIFSPVFLPVEKIQSLTDIAGKKLNGKLFFYIGGKESERELKNMRAITNKLAKNSTAIIYIIKDDNEYQQEKAWRKWFPEFYNWSLAKGFNSVVDLKED